MYPIDHERYPVLGALNSWWTLVGKGVSGRPGCYSQAGGGMVERRDEMHLRISAAERVNAPEAIRFQLNLNAVGVSMTDSLISSYLQSPS